MMFLHLGICHLLWEGDGGNQGGHNMKVKKLPEKGWFIIQNGRVCNMKWLFLENFLHPTPPLVNDHYPIVTI